MQRNCHGSGGLATALGNLLAKVRDEPDDQRKNNADEDGCSQREVELYIPAAPGKVAGQPAEWQPDAAGKDEHCADGYEDKAETENQFAYVSHMP